MRRTVSLLLGFLATAFTGGCAALPFHPHAEVSATPALYGMSYEDIRIPTEDGELISGWFIPAKDRETGAGKTLLFFHGNAGNIGHRLDSIAIFHQLGLSVCIIDYRGFGNSTGKPSVNGAVTDGKAALAWLLENKGLTPGDIVIFGRSMGGGVAAAVAEGNRVAGLILESTFTSLYDVADDMFPWLPVSLFLPQDFDTPARLAGMQVPLLVVHSPDDDVIPFRLGRSLYQGYHGPKKFLEISGRHNNGFMQSFAIYTAGLSDFLGRLGESRE